MFTKTFFGYVIQFSKRRAPQFDAEDAIGLSSPYKGTAERSSAAKKPHKNGRNPPNFFGGFQPYIGLFQV